MVYTRPYFKTTGRELNKQATKFLGGSASCRKTWEGTCLLRVGATVTGLRTHPNTPPPPAPYLPKVEDGRAGAVATAGPGSSAWMAGASLGAEAGRSTSSRAASAGMAGGKPSSSTLVTVLPMVNQSLIWSTVSLRNILGTQELPQLPSTKDGKSLK